MSQKHFWSGFAVGAGGALAGIWASAFLMQRASSRVIRVEKSVQIGRSVNDVFDAWSHVGRMPQYSNVIRSVATQGDISHWVANLDGRDFEWNAEIVQVVPNQVISWKSVSGPKHTGRVTFSPIGKDTLVHVQMNVAPPMRLLSPLASVASGNIADHVEQVLRDFKSTLEGSGNVHEMQRQTQPDVAQRNEAVRGTGTYGPELATGQTNPKFGKPDTPVEFTRPPESKYP